VSALQGSTVECAAGDLETRPAACEGEVKSELKFALDGAVQTIISEMGVRLGEVNQRLDRMDATLVNHGKQLASGAQAIAGFKEWWEADADYVRVRAELSEVKHRNWSGQRQHNEKEQRRATTTGSGPYVSVARVGESMRGSRLNITFLSPALAIDSRSWCAIASFSAAARTCLVSGASHTFQRTGAIQMHLEAMRSEVIRYRSRAPEQNTSRRRRHE
jgi:hypothetical protein